MIGATYLTITNDEGEIYTMFRVEDLTPKQAAGKVEARFLTAIEIDPATKKDLEEASSYS